MLAEKIAANQRLRAEQERLGLSNARRLPFLCECTDVSCRDVVTLTSAEYAAARATANRCVCIEGHPHEGRVVAAGEGYVIAEGA